jgi:hypothetical protein
VIGGWVGMFDRAFLGIWLATEYPG